MTYIGTKDYLTEVARGNVSGASIIQKFGHNGLIGTTFVPVTGIGTYETPQVGSATALRIKAGGNANDTAAGSGAREVTIEGINELGAFVSEAVATAGALASAKTAAKFIRMFRAYVSASGTYATSTAGSHAADITIENGAGGTDWSEIHIEGFPLGQTERGVYTIPEGYTGYLLSASGFTDGTKITEILFFKREGILKTVAPYDAMRIVFDATLEGGEFTHEPKAPLLIGTGCDCGFMAKVNQGTANVQVDFEILLIQN